MACSHYAWVSWLSCMHLSLLLVQDDGYWKNTRLWQTWHFIVQFVTFIAQLVGQSRFESHWSPPPLPRPQSIFSSLLCKCFWKLQSCCVSTVVMVTSSFYLYFCCSLHSPYVSFLSRVRMNSINNCLLSRYSSVTWYSTATLMQRPWPSNPV